MKEYSRDFKVKTIFIAQDHFDELGGKMIVIYPHMYGNVSLYDAYQFDQYGTSSPKVMDDIVAASAKSEKRTKLRITATNGDVYEFLSMVEYVNNIDYGPDYMYNAPYFAHEINLAVERRNAEQAIPAMYKPESEPTLRPTYTGDWINENYMRSISYSTGTDTLLNDQYKGDSHKKPTDIKSDNYTTTDSTDEMDHRDYPKPTPFSSIHESWQGN